ncbi:MAG TPA: biopolymer transporter ExbD [Gemmatimonadaceae bacterium]
MPARRNAVAHAPQFEMNVTPMLDVLLVLLVIFMAASIRVYHSLDAQLPVPCKGVCEGGETIVLEVAAGPAYRVNGVAVPPGQLDSYLRDIYATRPTKIIEVAGHAGTTYSQVFSAIDQAEGAGVRVVGIMLPSNGFRP